MKKTIKFNLSLKSLSEAIQSLEKYIKALNSGTEKGVKAATEALYKKVIDNCNNGNLSRFTSSIHYEYDKSKNEGKVWTDDLVIIINEFGSGIKGTQDSYASQHEYTVNLSGKGETGWAFPTRDGDFKWTHGIRSKHMFLEAYEEFKKEFGKYVNISLNGEIGKIY